MDFPRMISTSARVVFSGVIPFQEVGNERDSFSIILIKRAFARTEANLARGANRTLDPQFLQSLAE